MAVAQFTNAPCWGVAGKERERRSFVNLSCELLLNRSEVSQTGGHSSVNKRRVSTFGGVSRHCQSISDQQALNFELHTDPYLEDILASTNGSTLHDESTQHSKDSQNLQTELIMLSLPAIAGQVIEPLAQLMETAYIGRPGPLELASASVLMSIFNIVSKVFSIPLLSVATSFVAEDISRSAGNNSAPGGQHQNGAYERKELPSVSTASLLALELVSLRHWLCTSARDCFST